MCLWPQRYNAAGADGVPVVELLLGTAPGDNGVLSFGFGDQRFGLAALHPLFEILPAHAFGFAFGKCDSGNQRNCMAASEFHFDLGGDAVGGIGCKYCAFPASALAGVRLRERVLKLMETGEERFKSETLLLFFETAHAKQAAKGIGDRHV